MEEIFKKQKYYAQSTLIYGNNESVNNESASSLLLDFFINTLKSIPESVFSQDCKSSVTLAKSSTDINEKKLDNAVLPVQVVSNKIADFMCENTLVSTPEVTFPKSSEINNRFTPGFAPKPKKRKFVGPAGLCFENDRSHNITKRKSASTSTEIDLQDITNSQFFVEDLQLPSWLKLQSEVSSHPSILSSAKYYSIRRVLNETLLKKLPKHIVVPVLCVLIKKFNRDDPTTHFIDDTGEINGKFDCGVFDSYSDFIKEGTALILKNVKCLCNILVIHSANIISFYFKDGSVKHIQELTSILDEEKPLKPMTCGCPVTPTEKAFKSSASAGSSAPKQLLSNLNSMPLQLFNSTKSNLHSAHFNPPHQCNSAKTEVRVESNESDEDLLDDCDIFNKIDDSVLCGEPFGEENELDDFDEFLGNLDEKSFLGEY